MFYDRFMGLCKERGVSPSAVMVSIGLNKSNATFWKKGSIPKGDTLRKLADYFGVSVDYLLGKSSTVDGYTFSDGTGYGGGTGSGAGFGDGTGYGGPIEIGSPANETLRLMEHLERLFVDAGLIAEGEDLSPEDTEFLLLTIRQIEIWFEKRDIRAETAPQSLSPTSGGKDTTPPPDASETPPEGK